MKKLTCLALAALMLLSMLPAVLAEADDASYSGMMDFDPMIMYVYTENGGVLNVRKEPAARDGNVIGQLEYGAMVETWGVIPGNPDWMMIKYSKGVDGVAYVMSRYLVETRPSDADERAKKAEEKKNLEELNREMSTARVVDTPFMVAVRASRSSGWVNFRVGPGVSTERIAGLPDGRQLKVVGQTDNWYQAVDSETGKMGYIHKNYVTVLNTVAVSETKKSEHKETLGTLNVNGVFMIRCSLPETYEIQVVNMQGTKMVASVLSTDAAKPMLYLTIAYDEMYAGVERMNDLDDEALKAMEATFTQMNEVEITYRETSHGTKLLIAKEIGEDADFVDILSVYKGYSIEFVMTPGEKAKTQELTEEQIQLCIDFLSELDFVTLKKGN